MTKISKAVIMYNMYKPKHDYLFEKKQDGYVLHISYHDAANSIIPLSNRFNVQDLGISHLGNKYFITEKTK